MQFLIDTATDQPAELYRIGKFLVENYATAPAPPRYVSDETQGTGGEDTIIMPAAEAREVRAAAIARAVPPPPQPVFPGTPDSAVAAAFMQPMPQFPGTSDDDPEVTIDEDGAVQSVAAVVELPSAPPPPVPQPPPAPLFSVPPPPIPAPPGPVVAAERDSRGRPWDARIHAANRAKKIDGSWKTKRGVDATLVAQIEGSVPGNTPAPVPPMTGAQAEAISFGHLAAPPPPVPTVAPSTVTAPAIATSAPGASASTPIDFRGLMQKIQSLTAASKLTADQVNAVLAGVGLKPEEMAQLINNAPLIASVNAAVDKCTSP